MLLSTKDYKYKSWAEKFPTNKVNLEPDVNSTWIPLFAKLINNSKYKELENKLSELVKDGKQIYPYPDLVFSAFKFTPFDKVKVVIIGQDPYFHMENGIPQAMGLSFSVPFGINVPPSLQNIYKNMKRFGHLNTIPKHGNLQFIAYQGCLFLNTALTVTDGEKNSHSSMWKWMTDAIIKQISDELVNIIFVLWGGPALSKIQLIDQDKHSVIISSHPSGLSVNTQLTGASIGKPKTIYSSFEDLDHFGEINKILDKYKKDQIVYGL